MRALASLAVLIVVAAVAARLQPSSQTTPSQTTPAAAHEKSIADAATNIDDIVTIKYPNLTIMCSDRNDFEKVDLAGVFAMADVYDRETRVNNNSDGMMAAMKAKYEARKYAMGTAYSCKWARRDVRYRVDQKEIIGTEKDAFHFVMYCLRPSGENTCLWTGDSFEMDSPFNSASGDLTAEKLRAAGAKMSE